MGAEDEGEREPSLSPRGSAGVRRRRERGVEKMRYHTEKFRASGVETISAEEVEGMARGGLTVLLVDVRLPEERAVSVISGSMTKEEFESRYPSPAHVEDDSTMIVPYCTIGYRSGEYCKTLLSRGFANVRNSEGIVLWTYYCDSASAGTKNLLVDAKGEPTKRVHVYGAPWDLANPEYEAVKFKPVGWCGSHLKALWRCFRRGGCCGGCCGGCPSSKSRSSTG